MTQIIKNIVSRWSEQGMISETDEDIYEYGLELIFFSMINVTAILITAAIVGRALESIVLLMAIIPLQLYGGGYHAKTHLRCFLVMYIGWWGVIHILPMISSLTATGISIVSVTVISIVAPVPNAKLRRKTKLTKLL